MVEPITFAVALAIGKLACGKFFESSVGKLGEKFTEAGCQKIEELYRKVRGKLSQNPEAIQALTAVEKGSEDDLNALATYLRTAMNADEAFASEVQKLADEINFHRVEDNSSQTMNIYGGKGYQTKMGNENKNHFGDVHNYYGKPPED